MNVKTKINNKRALYGLLAAVTVTVLFSRILLPIGFYFSSILPFPGSEILGFIILFFGTFVTTYKLTEAKKRE